MPRAGKQALGAVAGFILGCVVWLLIYVLMQGIMQLFGTHSMHARIPIALLLAPIFGLVIGFKAGPEIFDTIGQTGKEASAALRLMVLAPAFWGVVVLAYVFVFNPFGYRIDNSEWLLVAKIVLFPTAVLWGGATLLHFVVLKK